MTHRPVTSTFAADRTTSVHFYCPCGVSRRLVVCNSDVHPLARFTSALRRLHERGMWPVAEVNAGDESKEAA